MIPGSSIAKASYTYIYAAALRLVRIRAAFPNLAVSVHVDRAQAPLTSQF
jgi:hypothetical protein